ncbi:MAG: TolC family protein [Spirochaetales bacterium]|nr:TolC family protein [Spirochaetales bacterium]
MKLSVEDAVDKGIEESFDLYSQKINLKISGKQSKLSKREWLPVLKFSFTGSDIINIMNSDSRNNNLSVHLTQQIFDGGASALRNKIQKQQMQLNIEQLEQAEFNLKNQLWLKYNQLLIQQTQLKLQKKSLSQAKKQLEIYRLEATQGTVTELELLQAEISVGQLELDIENGKTDFDDTFFQFRQLLGISPEVEIELIDTGITEYTGININLTISQIKKMALNYNIEYRSTLLELNQQRQQYKLTKLSYIPEISLEVSLGLAGEQLPLTTPEFSTAINIDFNDSETPISSTFDAGMSGNQTRNRTSSVSVTPFKGVGSLLNEKQSKLQIQELQEKIDKLIDSIPHAVISSYNKYNQKREAVRINHNLLILKKRELNILVLKQQQGDIKRSELIEEQIDYSEDETALLQNILELIQIEQEFAIALGLTPSDLHLLATKTEVNSDEKSIF